MDYDLDVTEDAIAKRLEREVRPHAVSRQVKPPSLFDPTPREARSWQTKLYMSVSEPVIPIMVT